MTMRAAMYYGSGDVRLDTVEIPKIGPGEVLLKVGAALTCGTDFKAYRQGHPVLLGDDYPAPFGHEVAGTVANVGVGVSGLFEGSRVVAANSAPCDDCFYCRRGRPNLCDNLKLLNGAYAEYIRIPPQIVKHNLYEIPDDLSFRAAALTEPLACAVHAFARLRIRRGESVVILGCGVMGLLFASVARANGVRVIAVGRNALKLRRAREIGAEHVFDIRGSADDVVEDIRAVTPGRQGAEFVVEAVGNPQAWDQAFRLTRKGGTVCFFAGCARGSSFPIDTHRLHYEEVSVTGVFHHTPEHFAQALDYLARGVVDAEAFITAEVPLGQIPEYFRRNAHNSLFKVAVVP